MSRIISTHDLVRKESVKDLDQYPDWDLTKPLPRLPVPNLQCTLANYLKAVEPIVSKEDYARTCAIVTEFGQSNGLGETIQDRLKETAETVDNWVNDWWLNDVYLNQDAALPIHSSPGLVFPRQHFSQKHDQMRFAARLILAALDYKALLDNRGLPVERASHHEKGQPLCMEQYYRLFSSYRYPGSERDFLVTNMSRDPFDPEYIVVACQNQFYALEINESMEHLTESHLFQQLCRIDELATSQSSLSVVEPIGILTSLNRSQWFCARNELIQLHEHNRQTLKRMEHCCFLLCLDGAPEQGQMNASAADDVTAALQILHGFGSKCNGANRWYDKTMQFIVDADGNCGLNYEHSVAEGIVVIKLIEHILKYMELLNDNDSFPQGGHSPPPSPPPPLPSQLTFRVNSVVNAYIAQACQKLDTLTDNLDIEIVRFNKYGRNFPKLMNMSPDSYMQLALQLTHYRIHGHLVTTYESASIRRFHLGRVDNIRAASMPALRWCQAMIDDTHASTKDKVRLLREAIDWQTNIMLDNILGRGLDNHLLGLRETAAAMGLDPLDIFKDKTYFEANNFRLSTSQVPTSMDTYIAYGAVVPNGYGAAYNPHAKSIVVAISCWKTCPNLSARTFAEKLDLTLTEMQQLLLTEKANNEISY